MNPTPKPELTPKENNMKITLEWLKNNNACPEGVAWFNAQSESDAKKVVAALMDANKLSWANWTVCHLFNRKQGVQYAVFAAGQVLHIYERKYPDDKRPRLAIEAARKCIETDTKENRVNAYYAANAAYDAAYAAAYATDAAYAAYAATDVAAAAYAATDAAAYAATDAAAAAYAATDVAANAAADREKLQIEIIEYGMRILECKTEGK